MLMHTKGHLSEVEPQVAREQLSKTRKIGVKKKAQLAL